MDDFNKLGVTVIGVSHDPIEKLDAFSLSECRSKFPVAADDTAGIMKSYDAVTNERPDRAQRVSYVIAPDGTVIHSYTAAEPTHHVEYAMAAVKKYETDHPR